MGLSRSPILSGLPGLNADARDRIHAEYERAVELLLEGSRAAWQEFCVAENRARAGSATAIDRLNALQSAQHAELRAKVAAHVVLFDAIALEYAGIDDEREAYVDRIQGYALLAVQAILPAQDTDKAVREAILARVLFGMEGIRPILFAMARSIEYANTAPAPEGFAAQPEEATRAGGKAVPIPRSLAAELVEAMQRCGHTRQTAASEGRRVRTRNAIIAALEGGDRKRAVELWQKWQQSTGLAASKCALYNDAGQDKADYYRWERKELRDGSQADQDIRKVLMRPFS